MSTRNSITFGAKILSAKPLNDEFTLCKCYIMAVGKNKNRTYISQKSADKALPSLYNIPVIGYLYQDESGEYHMGGHEHVLCRDKDGSLYFKSLCVPYGVVPNQNDVHYEEVKEPDGTVGTYAVADVILWTGRFPELKEAAYNKNTLFWQSMEINVNNSEKFEEDASYTNILDYSYSALCLLGKSDDPEYNIAPCFPMARVEAYNFSSENDTEFSLMMSQLKNELASCLNNNVEVKEEKMENTSKENIVDYSSLYSEKRRILQEALDNRRVIVRDDDGDVVARTDYWLEDFDDVYVYVTCGSYDFNGNNDTWYKGRFSYTFNDSDKTAVINGECEPVFVRWLTADEASKLEAMQSEYETLSQYKIQRELEDKNTEIDKVIGEFQCLSEIDEFKTVEQNRYTYSSPDELRNACYIIKGKYADFAASDNKNDSETVVRIDNTNKTKNLYERFHERFKTK